MIILADCLSRRDDEGYVKLAKKITTLIQENNPSVNVISVNDNYDAASEKIYTKSFLSLKLLKDLKGKNVLFLSPGTNSLKVSVKLFFLSLYCKSLSVIFVQNRPMTTIIRTMLRLSKVKIICLADGVAEFFEKNSDNKVFYVRAGLDFSKYKSCNVEEKRRLRKKYGFAEDDIIVTHVGHMKKGRNLQSLLPLSKKYKILFVTSSTTEQEEDLKKQLLDNLNTKVIDSYIPNIAEIYQITDCYLFPVKDSNHCIGVPLSVLEACACNIPIVTTRFGELRLLDESEHFVFDSFEDMEQVSVKIDSLLSNAKVVNNRDKIELYDWSNTLKSLERIVNLNE